MLVGPWKSFFDAFMTGMMFCPVSPLLASRGRMGYLHGQSALRSRQLPSTKPSGCSGGLKTERSESGLTRVGGESSSVTNRSIRPTTGCFLSPVHWKIWIMLEKGKTPKVRIALARVEPVRDIPEGRQSQDCVTAEKPVQRKFLRSNHAGIRIG